MGYYDETDLTRGKTKTRRSIKPFFSTLLSGVVGGALVLGVTTYNDQNEEQAISANSKSVVESSLQEKNTNTTSTVTTEELSTNSGSIADIVDNLGPAIVGITQMQEGNNIFGNEQGQSVESGTGSGFIFKKEGDVGYVLTNNHVIEGASSIEVTLYDGEKVSAQLV